MLHLGEELDAVLALQAFLQERQPSPAYRRASQGEPSQQAPESPQVSVRIRLRQDEATGAFLRAGPDR